METRQSVEHPDPVGPSTLATASTASTVSTTIKQCRHHCGYLRGSVCRCGTHHPCHLCCRTSPEESKCNRDSGEWWKATAAAEAEDRPVRMTIAAHGERCTAWHSEAVASDRGAMKDSSVRLRKCEWEKKGREGSGLRMGGEAFARRSDGWL